MHDLWDLAESEAGGGNALLLSLGHRNEELITAGDARNFYAKLPATRYHPRLVHFPFVLRDGVLDMLVKLFLLLSAVATAKNQGL
eukprot:1293628-Rhodomonas_salina.1